MNKSLATNLISMSVILIGYFSPIYPEQLLAVGLFATSGAITNWLAIHMLFEKVPGLYGSGVIPNQFEEFKIGIHHLIMDQFFNQENVEDFFAAQSEDIKGSFDAGPVVEAINYDVIYSALVDVVLDSPFGGMLGMVGGPSALQPIREPFIAKMREETLSILSSPSFLDAVQSSIGGSDHTQEIIEKVDRIVNRRLDELTPEMVKSIIQDMIRKHLGWLVVWGGVFGGLIGLITSFLL